MPEYLQHIESGDIYVVRWATYLNSVSEAYGPVPANVLANALIGDFDELYTTDGVWEFNETDNYRLIDFWEVERIAQELS